MFGFGGLIQIKQKRGGNNSWGWENEQQSNSSGWGQQQQSTGGWGQPAQQSGGWGQPAQQSGGWGQPAQQSGGWGQPAQQSGGWGQPAQQTGGWGQPQQPQQQQGGWGQPQQQQQGGWGNQQGGNWGTNPTWGNNLSGNTWIQNQQQQQKFTINPAEQMDIAKYIEQQIVQIEPSPAKAKLEDLRKKGQKYIDDRFPANNGSLSGEWGNVSEWKDIKWIKLSEKVPAGKIFVGKPEPQDIKQGYLGDCYFLAGLAALAERPDRILNLFLLQEKNQLNYYSVKMLYKGKWMTIDVDEYVPWLYNSPAFSKSVQNQLWVVILEKAWAKLYTSYKRIQAGYPEEPLHDLTGAPIKQIMIKKGNYNKQEEWNYLMKASQKEYSMVCSSNPGSDSDTSQTGVVQGHAYTLLQVIILNFQGQQHRLVQLRNPWGKGQFKGQWSDKDPNWNLIDPAEKKRIGYTNQQDGTFYIPFETFWSQFRSITIAQIEDNASYLYKSYKDPNKQGCYFKLDIKKKGVYSLQIDKTPERSFEDKRQNDYNYPRATVQLGILNNGSIQKMQGFSNSSRTTQQKYEMQPGVYIVKVLVDFSAQWDKQFDVNLAVYAEFPCVITLASTQEATALAGKQVAWNGKDSSESTNQTWNSQAGWGVISTIGNGGWGQEQGQGQGGWGQPQQQAEGAWNQNQQPQQGGWGQGSGQGSGWGQPQQPQQGGWGQPQQPQQGGWGQGSGQGGSGWNQPTQGGNSWGQQGGSGW